MLRCCIAGCGPAGALAGYLLARAGVNVVVLEKHGDFLRDFRGDTIHPSALEILDEVGLTDRFLELPHTKVSRINMRTIAGQSIEVSFERLRTKFPFVAMVPQWDFLEFLTACRRASSRSESADHTFTALVPSTLVVEAVTSSWRGSCTFPQPRCSDDKSDVRGYGCGGRGRDCRR